MQVEPARLAQPSRPRLPESGGDRHDGRARVAADDLELVALAHGRLVDVTREDEVGPRVHERAEDVAAVRDRPLARRPPRRADQVVVEDGHAERSVLGLAEPLRSRARELRPAQRAALVAERTRRVEPDDMKARRRGRRLGRLPDPLELRPRPHEPRRRVREVVVAGHREHRRPERAQQARGPLELLPAAAMCARSPEATTSCGSSRSTSRASACSTSRSSCVPVCRSDTWRSRASTTERGYRLAVMAEDSAEIFDDLYLGVRAGGALRKQRRGEELTAEEREALSRWQRLSTARKAAAIGAFAAGTFGLGFTLGGLVFGRWRRA